MEGLFALCFPRPPLPPPMSLAGVLFIARAANQHYVFICVLPVFSLEHQLRENNREKIFLLFTAVSLGPRTGPDTQCVPSKCLLNERMKICPQGEHAGIVVTRILIYMIEAALTVDVCKLECCAGWPWKGRAALPRCICLNLQRPRSGPEEEPPGNFTCGVSCSPQTFPSHDRMYIKAFSIV